ncbi:fucolectin-5-like [Tubulanus polymorphus]|uniref:fucolectin-5-like n=1 Tax=Tubulanus polymorphus TaxID=672921 RepID=UPI003DA1DF0D
MPCNVARDKQATSSSVLTYSLYGPDKCVDGLISGGREKGLCHTKNETDAWFQVDLDAQHVVLGVDLYDRSDATNCDNNPDNSWKRRSRNLEVRVGNNTARTNAGVPGSNVKCGYHGPALCGGHIFIRCSTPLIGRYVTVQHHGIGKREYLGLAEVEVRGYVYTGKP